MGTATRTVEEWDGPVRVTCSWDEYERDFQDAGVDVSLVFNIAWSPESDPKSVNDATGDFVASAPDRRIGFMSVHPHDRHALDRALMPLEGGQAGAPLQVPEPHRAVG